MTDTTNPLGLDEHSHGADVQVPDSKRDTRTRSFDVSDFPVPNGREEEWRFSPVRKLSDFFTDAASETKLTTTGDLPEGISVEKISLEAAQELGILEPEDRAAAVAANRAATVTHYSVPAGTEIDGAVIIHADGTGNEVSHGHVVVSVGANAKATIVVEHAGLARHSELVSLVIGDGANVTFVSLQLWDDESQHMGQHDAIVGKDAKFKHIVISLGGDIVRLNTNVRYSAAGGEAELLGLYFADAGQHFEHRTYIDHNTPKATSNVHYKGALQGKDARSVWIGDVLIRPEALDIDTYELNRNLILSDGARADSVPNLEIETGDIAGAGHASSTGRFDEEHLFYLMSRGIPEDIARQLVVRGFFNEVIQKIQVPEIEEVLNERIEEELSRSVL
ncbi:MULTISPECIES: Fe-S cluster assembly protein SufD [Brevibacterium]|uniref:Iron-regulated ABC transporter permease protein SufD n=2 Tax=Brevibacterium antiquum TaxID=234835 RepID=A0A2H1HPD4_9MICO|nr:MULTISPECIES: Fe-S cluster assembly protein SufD [Brevibacterium]SMX64754.1 Iron-regulated ABC transporter permease protein SufD [Brevibacterium antiquum CNRZ 918]SMX65461.1 Iron-regulated ABC transporter permease protein SufD [Brevibacterium antiquum]HCG57286.1 Fe-S cluster assembly protein SufD [Brevibacterium sp.]